MAAPKYIKNASGVLTEQAAAVTSAVDSIVATGASGLLDITLMPTGVGPDIVSAVASEALSAGNLVNLYSNAGTVNVRKADASSPSKEANGYVIASVSNAGTASVYLSGLNTAVTGRTVGKQFLSATPGSSTTTAPSTSGQIVQQVGFCDTATSLQFTPQLAVTLA